MVHQVSDVEARSGRLPLHFQRTYNSLSPDVGPFGIGWTHSYNVWLDLKAPPDVTLHAQDGAVFEFKLDGSTYEPPPGIHRTLTSTLGGWTLEHRNGVVQTFEEVFSPFTGLPIGRLASTEDLRGNAVDLTYDLAGDLTTITDPAGRTITLTYDLSHHVISLTDPLSRTFEYDYDGDLLTSVTYPNETEATYLYADNRMTHLFDPWAGPEKPPSSYTHSLADGKVIRVDFPDGSSQEIGYSPGTTVYTNTRGYTRTVQYDGLGDVITTTNAFGDITTYVYDAEHNITNRTDASNHTTTYTYDANGGLTSITNPQSQTSLYTHNANNQLIEFTDALSRTTTYIYDHVGNLLRVTDPLSNVTSYGYDGCCRPTVVTDTNGHVAHYSYDGVGNRAVMTDALGYTTVYTHDVLGRLLDKVDPNGGATHIAYDAAGNVLTTTNPMGTISTYSYDPVGNRISETDANGYVTAYEYDPLNRLVVVTDTIGYISTYSYDPAGNRISETDANGHAINYSYDPLDRLVTVTDTLGYISTFSYDPVGNRISETDANGHAISYSYDSLDRLVVITDPVGTISTYSYDPVGNRIGETDANGYVTAYEYDPLNRIVVITDALDYTTGYSYDPVGNRIGETDAHGYVTTYEYDSLNRLVVLTDALDYTIGYSYDPVGNRIGETDANGHTTSYEYDPLGRRIKEETADGESKRYDYDGVGNITVITDANGTVTTYTYDDLNRLADVAVSPAPGVGGVTFEHYEYDSLGLMTHAENDFSAVTWDHDALGRVLTETQNGLAIAYQYDAAGNRVRLTYPDGRFITYEPDELNRTDLIKEQDGSLIADYDYLPGSEVETITYGNGTESNAGYDANGRVISLTHKMTPTAGFGYGYDAAGNRRYELREHDGGAGDAYDYDKLYQLTGIRYGISDPVGGTGDPDREADYLLDGVGNRATMVVTTTAGSRTFSYTNNEVNEYEIVYENLNGMALFYDDNGNLIRMVKTPPERVYLPLVAKSFGGLTAVTAPILTTPADLPVLILTTDATAVLTTIDYDYKNRPVSLTLIFTPTFGTVKRISTTFKYDAVGRRIGRTTDTTATLYYYDGLQAIEERENSSTTAQYVYGRGLDEVLQMTRGGHVYYYHVNGPGSIMHITDENGQVVEQYAYDAYGDPTIYDGGGTPLGESSIGNPYLFTGRRYDGESGFYYYRARYYSPALGRFLQRDPLGVGEDTANRLNAYTYVGNNPLNYTDPDGTRTCCSGSVKEYWSPTSCTEFWSRGFVLIHPTASLGYKRYSRRCYATVETHESYYKWKCRCSWLYDFFWGEDIPADTPQVVCTVKHRSDSWIESEISQDWRRPSAPVPKPFWKSAGFSDCDCET